MVIKNFNPFNHNNLGDPHEQYDHYYRVQSALAPDNSHLWIQVFNQKFAFDTTGLKDNDTNTLRRLELNAHVFDGVSEADADDGDLYFYVYATKNKDASRNDNGQLVVNLGLHHNYVDISHYHHTNLPNYAQVFRAYVKNTGNLDASGVPIFIVSLYGRVYSNTAVMSIQPYGCRFTLSHNYDATGTDHLQRNALSVVTNPNATNRARLAGLFDGFETREYVSQADMEAAHQGESVYDTIHPDGPKYFEQVYRNETGNTAQLKPMTTLLTVANSENDAYPLYYIKPSGWQDYTGYRLDVLTFGNVNFINSATFGITNKDDGLALKNKTDKIYDAGTILQFIRYQNYWVEV